MGIAARDIIDEVEHRHQQAAAVTDRFGSVRETYADWKTRVDKALAVYAGELPVLWPDHTQSHGLPKIPNLVQIAADDRARLVAATTPSLMVPPFSQKDQAKIQAERRERFLSAYWDRNRVKLLVPRWAHDLMFSGLAAVRILADTRVQDKAKRSPVYQRIDPRWCYPSPIFAPGPWVDDILIAYEEQWVDVARRFEQDVSLGKTLKRDLLATDRVRVVEFYDGTEFGVLCTLPGGKDAADRRTSGYLWLAEPARHGLRHPPVVVGVRPTPDGIYRGEFDNVLALMHIWNRLVTLELDAGIQRVYPATLDWEIENPQDWGPDAELHAQSRDARFEVVQPPGAAYSNFQLVRLLSEAARAVVMLSPGRTGDPNESVISAAGISAAQAIESDDVRSLQRDALAPMLEAANELAFEVDERFCDADKTISGFRRGSYFEETYRPSKDIDGRYENRVVYGFGSGLDEVNTNVMILQQWAQGNGIISRRAAMEHSPMVEDPTQMERQLMLEKLDAAMQAGLIAKAATGELTPGQLAAIAEDIESNKPLRKAVADNVLLSTPLAQPAGTPALPGAPGMAGASRGEQPIERRPMPPMEEVLAGRRP